MTLDFSATHRIRFLSLLYALILTFIGIDRLHADSAQPKQYFLWYLILLPFYLSYSSFLANPRLGITALVLWVVAQVRFCTNYFAGLSPLTMYLCTQALWLHQAYRLEFLGLSTFVPGLFVSGLLFFGVNVWILGIMVEDIGARRKEGIVDTTGAQRTTNR